jgi:hypothetical protein
MDGASSLARNLLAEAMSWLTERLLVYEFDLARSNERVRAGVLGDRLAIQGGHRALLD